MKMRNVILTRLNAPLVEFRRRLAIVQSLLGSDFRRRWIFATFLGVGAGALEAVSAVLFLVFLGAVADPRSFGDGATSLNPAFDWVGRISTTSLAVALLAFYVVRAVVSLFQSYWQFRAADEEGARLASRVLQAYLKLPLIHQRAMPSAQVMRDVNDSSHGLARQMFQPLLTVLAEALLVLAMAVLLFVTLPLMTLVVVLILGVIFVGTLRLTQPKLARLGCESQSALTDSLKWVRQSIEGARDIKAYGAEQMFQSRFSEARSRFIGAMHRSSTLTGAPRVVIETAFILFVVVLVMVVNSAGETETLVPTLALFAYVALRLLPALNRIALAFTLMRFGGAIASELSATLARLEALAEPNLPPLDRPIRESVELRDVSFRYGEHQVLDRVSLTVSRGEVVGIVGPSGGGKSTLLDILAGLLAPHEGQVLLDGQEVRSLRHAGVSVALVSQTAFVADDSLEANVAFGLTPDQVDRSRVGRVLRAANLESMVGQRTQGVAGEVGESGNTLSGGQRQRVVLARAMYREAELTIVDEGTSALDESTERSVIEDLVEGLRGKALVIVSHRPSALLKCDRVYELSGGFLQPALVGN